MNELSDEEDTDDPDYIIESITTDDADYDIDWITCPQFGSDVIYTYLQINGHEINVKVDSGAKCNVLPRRLLQQINCEQHLNTNSRPTLQAYGGTSINTCGVASLKCFSGGQSYDVEFKIVDSSQFTVPILGCRDSLRMSLLTLNDQLIHAINLSNAPELETYADLFENKLGDLPVKYKMTLDPTVPPVIRPPRRVPKPMEEPVRKELKRMIQLGVITPMLEPSEWVSHMVATKKKSGEIRLCIDPKDLNRALTRPHHPMRTVEETTMNLTDAKVFTVLDAKTSFWQIPLDEQSSKLTTFHSPAGRMRFSGCRMVLTVAPRSSNEQ